MLHITIVGAIFKMLPELVFYGGVGLVSFVFGFFAINYVPSMLILSTAYDGALMASFFFGQYLGGFPHPLKINGGLTGEEHAQAVGYVVLILVLGTFGAHNQLRVASANGAFRREQRRRQRDEGEEREREPLLSEAEKGKLDDDSKMIVNEFRSPNRKYAKPRIIGAAPLFENGKRDNDNDD